MLVTMVLNSLSIFFLFAIFQQQYAIDDDERIPFIDLLLNGMPEDITRRMIDSEAAIAVSNSIDECTQIYYNILG